MTFLEFINNKTVESKQEKEFFEAFNETETNKALELIHSLFKKKINGTTLMMKNPADLTSNNKKMFSYIFINTIDKKQINALWTLNFLKSASSDVVYSIDLYSGNNANEFLFTGKGKTTLTIDTLGSSIAYFIPIICKIVSSSNYNLSEKEATKTANSIMGNNVTESKLYIGAYSYTIYEGLSDKIAEDTFYLTQGYIQEESSELQKFRWAKKEERDIAYINRKKSKEAMDLYNKINTEYREILNAIRGGAQTIGEVKLSLNRGVKTTLDYDESTLKAEEELNKQKEDPETTFKKMQIYVKSVITGQQPGVLLCGAPGVGKTYRVTQQLKAAGYKEGNNLLTIKGNCSPAQLYIEMYGFKEKGNIIVVDDADALVAPNNDLAANMLKAALDSTSDDEGRLVTYKVRGELKDEEGFPIPKSMYFNAGMIIITNKDMGELNEAVRGRVFTQNIYFDVEQILELIKNLIPKIDPDKLKISSKEKAYDYLLKLAKEGTDMVISIRSFAAAARLYELTEDEDLTEEEVDSMIKEQMCNQALTGKNKR